MEFVLALPIDRVVISAMNSDRRKYLALLEAHGPALLAMLRRLCGNAYDADDVYQDTAMRVWKYFASRPRLRSPKAWLMTVAYRAFVDHCGRKRKHEPFFELPDPRVQEPADNASQSEQARCLHKALDELAPAVRQVLVLHYTGGMSLRDTAGAMGISIGTVKSRLNAGLEALRSLM